MAQLELRRRLSMSSDAQWTTKGRNITSSGYALSPASANTSELDPTTTSSPPPSPGSSNGSVRTRQLNASSIFARLGLADSSSLPVPAGPTRSGSSSSSSSSTLHGNGRTPGLSSFESLRANDITPTVNGGREATSYMDASNSDHHLGRTSVDNETPTKMMPIEADILLPFADRPSEVKELLEDTERNRGLYELLKETFTVRSANSTSANLTTANLSASPPSSPSVSPAPEEGTTSETSTAPPAAGQLTLLRSQDHKRQDSTSTVTPTTPTGEFYPSSSSSSKKWTFSDLQSHLQIPRSVLCDQDWIDILKANVYPRSLLLWERLRACLGVDVDDEQGGDRYEPLSSDIEPPGMEGMGQMSRSASSNSNLDLLLSPRAILSRMASSATSSGTNDNPPASALSSVFSSSLDSNACLPSPAGYSNNNLNAFSFSSPQKSSSATQPMSIPNASHASPSRSPNFSLKELESPVSRSPVTPTSTSMAAARNHRRSSSGGSSFRKAFAMSSINEDSPLDNFESRDVPPSSSGLKTPENELQQQASVNDTVRNDGRVDLGSLLRLKGFGVGDVAPPPSTATSSSMPPFSPQLPSSTGPSSYGVTNSAAPGHLPPPTPLSPTMSMSRSFSSSSLSGVGVPRSPNFSASPFLPSTSSPSSALGLKLANPTNFLGSNASSSNSSSAANSPTKSMQKYRDSRRDSYDEYISVFGGSEEERSVSGASVQSRGQGPHMRFSFGSQDAATPALNEPRGGSGFALAGLQNQNRSTGTKHPASARVVAVNESGSGNSTPKAR